MGQIPFVSKKGKELDLRVLILGEALGEGLKVSHVNLNDGTVEGLHHRDLPVLSVQYHCEAAPGPLDSMYLFERFLQMVGDGSG